MKIEFKHFAMFWIALMVIIFLFSSNVGLFFGMLAALILSYVLYKKTMLEHWDGKIIKIKDEQVRQDPDEDYVETVRYAYIKLSTGKTKKMQPLAGWKVGDSIVKEKGKMIPKKV